MLKKILHIANNTSQHTKLIWGALLAAMVRNAEFENGYEIIVGNSLEKYTLNDFVYFLGSDIMLLFISMAINSYHKSITSRFIVWLAIGKTWDEFVSPFHYSIGELVWDLVGLYVVYDAVKKRVKNTHLDKKIE